MVVYKLDKKNALHQQIEDLKKKVLGKKGFILFVHSAQCSFCVKMQDEWKKVRRRASQKYKEVPIIEVTGDAMYELVTQYPDNDLSVLLKQVITSYPTIAFVEQKHRPKKLLVHVYQDERTADKIDTYFQQYVK